jgi:hypothetical protein
MSCYAACVSGLLLMLFGHCLDAEHQLRFSTFEADKLHFAVAGSGV